MYLYGLHLFLLHHFYIYMYTICITKFTWFLKLLLHMICVIVLTTLPNDVHTPSSHWISMELHTLTDVLMFSRQNPFSIFVTHKHYHVLMTWYPGKSLCFKRYYTWSFAFWIFEATDMGDIRCTSLNFYMQCVRIKHTIHTSSHLNSTKT